MPLFTGPLGPLGNTKRGTTLKSFSVLERILNGRFDYDLLNWQDASTAPSTIVWDAGRALSVTDGVNPARLRQPFVSEPGGTYQISSIGTMPIRVGPVASSTEFLGDQANATRTFVATTAETWVSVFTTTNGLWLDNVSCVRIG